MRIFIKIFIMTKSICTFLLLISFSAAYCHQTQKIDSLFQLLENKNQGMGSAAIMQNGKLQYSKAFGYANVEGNVKSTPAHKYRIGSITKVFTSVLIFQLIDAKKLTLENKLSDFFPSLPEAKNISIAHLLQHRSGLHNFTNDSIYYSYYLQKQSQEFMLKLIAANPPDFMPGKKAEYSNTNYLLLGYIAEKITGKTYAQLVAERICKKINLKDTYVGVVNADLSKKEVLSYDYEDKWAQQPQTDLSIPGAAGSVLSTPTDLCQFITALFTGKLVSDSSLKAMKTIRDNYGMGLFQIPFYDRKAYGHNGSIDGFTCNLAYFPEDGVAVAYCTNGQVYPMNDILIGMLSCWFNRPYTLPDFSAAAVPIEELELYTGNYSSNDIPLKITVTRTGESLKAQATGQASFPLTAKDKGLFVFERAGIEMQFNSKGDGFTLKQGEGNYVFTKEK
jgi:CubicO group peptidase (beta-lactamase class C family)